MKNILIVDDEEDILELLKFNLISEGFQVETATNGVLALEKIKSSFFDLVILDVMMPELDGFETLKKIRQHPNYESIPIFFLTARADDINHIIGLEIGADDFIPKPISPRVLTARIKSLFRRNILGESVLLPEIIKLNGLEINRRNYTVKIKGETIFFPKKEFELLALFATNQGKIFTREQLLNKIWGEQIMVTERTVDVHISRLRDKLLSLGEPIETVKGVGYRFN